MDNDAALLASRREDLRKRIDALDRQNHAPDPVALAELRRELRELDMVHPSDPPPVEVHTQAEREALRQQIIALESNPNADRAAIKSLRAQLAQWTAERPRQFTADEQAGRAELVQRIAELDADPRADQTLLRNLRVKLADMDRVTRPPLKPGDNNYSQTN